MLHLIKKVVNIYIVYEISKSINIGGYQILENCLFGAVTLTKNADISAGILVMELDLIRIEAFHFVALD